MKTALALVALLASSGLQAWDCKFEREIDLELDLTDSRQLNVLAGAGDLEIRDWDRSDSARIRARICASEAEWLEESGIELTEGSTAEIAVRLPDTDQSWSLIGSSYAYMDLEVDVPSSMPLVVNDSSGDLELEGVASVDLKDSSGDIRIEDVEGAVRVRDSSGDIDLFDVGGDVIIVADSSGDIEGKDVAGSVTVERDSSGDIEFRDVGGDFLVERDSSGDIEVDRVAGDFRVVRDSSGEIRAEDVEGSVSVPQA